MIWLLSDLHGRLDMPGWKDFQVQSKPEDVLILLGDICLNDPTKENNPSFTETVLASEKNIWIVAGNHENMAYLSSLPEEDWNGGKIHRLGKNVLHLMSGYVYTLKGLHVLVLGGTSGTLSEAEIVRTYLSLEEYHNKVHYILTHDYYKRSPENRESSFEKLMGYIDDHVSYEMWYCGHHHLNKRLDEKHTVVYDKLAPLCP